MSKETSPEAIQPSPAKRKLKSKEDKNYRILRQINAFGYTWEPILTRVECRQVKRIAEAVKRLRGLQRLSAAEREAVRFLGVESRPDWAAKRSRDRGNPTE